MTDCEKLRRILRSNGWKHQDCADFEAALYLVNESGRLVEQLLGTFVAYGCQYHVQKIASGNGCFPTLESIVAATAAAGGPQGDPGDDVQPPLFG